MSPLHVAVAGEVSILIPLLLWHLGNIMEWFGWEGPSQIISFPALGRDTFPIPGIQPGLKEAALMHLPDPVFQIRAREDDPKDRPHSHGAGQALGSTSSVPRAAVTPDPRNLRARRQADFIPSTNSSRRKPGPYSTSKYVFQDQGLQRQKAGRSWRGNAAGWAVSMEQRDESVPSAGCGDTAAPKSIR